MLAGGTRTREGEGGVTFGTAVLAGLAALGIAGLGALVLGKAAGPALTRWLTGAMLRQVARDPYPENWAGLYPILQKADPRPFLETLMRTRQAGKAISRPLGSPIIYSPWQKLLFNPVHLFRLPTPEDAEIDTSVIIGPRAKKPLRVEIPILVTGMSFGGALSRRAKIALGRGATAAGTAMCTGEAYLPEEREAASKLVIQYHRGDWPNSPQNKPEILKNADAIEIQLGQGAQAGAPQATPGRLVDKEMAEVFGLQPGEQAVIRSRLKGFNDATEFKPLVRDLQEGYGVPVGLKIASSHHLERELEIAVDAGIDFFVVDGAEAGTHGGATILQDDVGLPTMHALVRTVRFLEERGARDRVSVIAAGGLRTPGDFLKAMALGADAVYIGTMIVLALIGDQMVRTLPGEPPTALVLHQGPLRDKLDTSLGADNVANFLRSCLQEMESAVMALGKRSTRDVTQEDLVALDPMIAGMCGVDLAHFPPGDARAAVWLQQAGREERAQHGVQGGQGSGAQPDRPVH